MSAEEYKEIITTILKHLERLEKKVDQLANRVDELYESVGLDREPRLLRGGRFITIEVSKNEVLRLLKKEKKPLSAAEVSEKLSISRSYSSSLLNELFRDKKVNKIRIGKIIKFEAA